MRARQRAAFVGVGQSRLLRQAEVPLGLLADEACRAAIADAGLQPAQIDGIACVPNQPFEREYIPRDGVDFVSKNFMLRTLGIEAKWGANCDMILGQSLIEAINAVESGMCNYALVFRALQNPGGKYGRTSSEEASGPAQFMAPYGRFPPAEFARMWCRYRDIYGSGSREQMATLVVQARKNGLMWKDGYWAQFKPEPLSIEQYINSRIIATPFCLYDCDLPVQVASAFVITTAERAADLPQRPAYIHGRAGAYFPASDSVLWQGFTLEAQLHAGRKIAADLWSSAGVQSSDIDAANVYDGFSLLAMLWLETFGFCGEGEVFDFIQNGRIASDGELPVNTNGGSLGCGRVHGAAQVAESILQVTDRAGPRQLKKADLILATVGTLSWSGAAFAIGRDPP